MLKKNTNIVIAIISFIIAVVGIIDNSFFETLDFTVMKYKELLNPFYLDWIFSGHSLRYNGLNYVDAFFDFLLLIGTVLFVASGYRNSRLIRFIFSIILLSNLLTFLNPFIFFAFKSYFAIWVRHLTVEITYYIINVFLIIMSSIILKHLKRENALQQEFVVYNGNTQSYFVKATNWQRFLHPLVDVFVTIVLFSQMLESFVNYGTSDFFRRMVQMNESWAEKNILLVLLCLRIIYYLLSESVLGATPAKFLTKTRVIDYSGEKPSFKNIAVRTISRIVPFEAFSFFLHEGWHDKWSETLVVKEK